MSQNIKSIACSKKSLTSLQVFRGLAALVVCFYHLDGRYRADTLGEVVQPVFEQRFMGGLFSYGHVGVDFFFVLSGFIIFWIHEKDLGKPAASEYYVLKRISRIYPILWAAVAFKFILAWIAGTLWVKGDLQMPSLLSTMFLLPVQPTFVSGAWTLVHEMLFYLMFLFGILLSKKVFWVGLCIWVLLILCLDFTGHYVRFEGALNLVFHPHNLQFVLGIAVAWLVRRAKQFMPWGLVSIIVGIALMALGNEGFTAQWEYQFLSVKTLVWGGAFGAIICGFVILDFSSRIHWPSIFLTIGDASYSIYLFHLILIAVWKKILAKSSYLMGNPQMMMALNALLTLLFCLLIWRFIEKPVLEWSNRRIKHAIKGA